VIPDTARIREEMMARRKALSPEERRVRSREIQTRLFNLVRFRKSKVVQFYIDFSGEVETREMIARAIEIGKEVVVPFLRNGNAELGLSRIRDIRTGICSNGLGFDEPEGSLIVPVPPERIELWVTPGVAFDLSLNRIGFGKGYYDRLFARSAGSYKIGLAYDFQLIEKLTPGPHDVKMNRIITELRNIAPAE